MLTRASTVFLTKRDMDYLLIEIIMGSYRLTGHGPTYLLYLNQLLMGHIKRQSI